MILREDFCKVLQSEKHGQILIIKDTNDDGCPAVFMKFVPQGFGVCGPTFSYTDEDEDEAWRKVDKAYDGLDIDKCEGIAENIHKMLVASA